MIVHTYNSSTRETEAGALQVKASLDYIARLSQKKFKNPKDVIKRLLELINEFNKAARYK
jgi:hypothetical protein